MTRSRIFAVLAFLVATPVLAHQVIQVQPIQRPVLTPQAQPNEVRQDADAAKKVMTIEEAKARIAELTKQKREMKTRLDEALKRIDDMTKRGGSLVRAYCESRTSSRNTAGGSEDCGRYTCGDVDGLCKKSCTVSMDCAAGFSCAANQCLTREEAANLNQ